MSRIHLYRDLAGKCGLELTEELIEKSTLYLDLLQKWRRKISLISDEDEEKLLRLHLFESFWASHHFFEGRRHFCDIGSGAGFPGVAATLYRPALTCVLIESNRKKCVFLETLSRALGLEIQVFSGRAEDYPGWAGEEIASARAIQISSANLRLLEEHRVELLLFHGAEAPTPGERWRCRERRLYPLSRNRWVSLFAPAK